MGYKILLHYTDKTEVLQCRKDGQIIDAEFSTIDDASMCLAVVKRLITASHFNFGQVVEELDNTNTMT